MLDSRSIKESLDKLLNESDTIFIVPHNRPDMDALGSAIGMALICKKYRKKYYIVIDEAIEKLESTTRKVVEDIRNEFELIKASDVNALMTKNSLMIGVDVNKDYLVSVKQSLPLFKNILIIDHHKTDDHTIKATQIFVDEHLSSVCEEVSRLLFLYGIKMNPDQANYLLAGIILDTNKMSKNASEHTYSVAARLIKNGADATVANNMFLEDFEHDRAIQRLVDNTMFPTYIYAIASDNDDSGKVYEPEDIAKASDYLLRYQINASFAIAHIDEETVSISARSKGIIDVSLLMKQFGGGGNEHSAAAKVKGMSIEDIKTRLNQLLIPTTYLQNIEMQDVNLHEEKGPVLGLTRKNLQSAN